MEEINEHEARSLEQANTIRIGKGVVPYNAKKRAWVLPGCLLTEHYSLAKDMAEYIDRHSCRNILSCTTV